MKTCLGFQDARSLCLFVLLWRGRPLFFTWMRKEWNLLEGLSLSWLYYKALKSSFEFFHFIFEILLLCPWFLFFAAAELFIFYPPCCFPLIWLPPSFRSARRSKVIKQNPVPHVLLWTLILQCEDMTDVSVTYPRLGLNMGQRVTFDLLGGTPAPSPICLMDDSLLVHVLCCFYLIFSVFV